MIDWNKYIGIPFKENGRDLKGLDCYGLVWIIHKLELGIDLPGYNGEYFSSLYDHDGIENLIARETMGRWKKQTAAEPFSTVVFRIRRRFSHVGLVIEKSSFIHSLVGCSVCIEDFDDLLWRNKVYGFYKYHPDFGQECHLE